MRFYFLKQPCLSLLNLFTNNIKRARIKPLSLTRTLLVPLIGLASLEPPDKQWVSTVYPNGKIVNNFSPNSSPTTITNNIKRARIKPLSLTRTLLVPLIGLEPIRYHYHRILSPARLPISPQRHYLLIFVAFSVIFW